MNFFMLGAKERLEGNMLMKLHDMIDWSGIGKYLKRLHKNDVDPQGGPKGYDHLQMFKAILLQQWHSLND